MAGKTIKGLTVEIGGNTTELQKALKKAETHSNSLGRELSDVNKLLKFDPDNVDKLVQKQQILTERVAATKEKLDILKEAEAQVQEQFEKGQINAEQMRAFQREIMYTENQMHGYEKAIEDTVKQLDAARVKQGEAISSFGMLKTAITEQEKQLTALKDKYKDTVHAEGENSTAARELKSEYDKLNAELTENKSRLKEVEKAADTLGQTENAALKPLNELKIRISEQEKTLGELTKTYQSTVLQYGKNSAEAQKLAANIRQLSQEHTAAKSKLSELEKAAEGLVPVEKSLTERLSDQKQELEKLKTQYVNTAAQYGRNSDEAKRLKKEILTLVSQINAEEKAVESTTKEITDMTGESGKAAKKLDDMGDSAEKSGDKLRSAASAIGNAVRTIVTVGGAAVAAAGAGLAAITKQSLDAYASYEQLVGGVETLFKDSAGIVQNYAENAYKTAGMSANTYMETVTGFSASLLQSLCGDTAQAADIADMAIRDMADNANKMGTDIESIQNAYQGFAKQNYTMLDNLKLGYGGTATEMARLINESGVLGDKLIDLSDTKNIGNSLSEVGFAKMIEAIHAVQGEMGITGTTAKEASETIEGSVASAKAAWENLLVGFGDENANLDDLSQKFVDSVTTAANNLVPRITQILSGIVNALPAVMPDILALGETILDEAVKTLDKLLKTISGHGKDIAETAGKLIEKLLSVIVDAVPAIVKTGVSLVGALCQAVLDALPDIADAAVDLVELLAVTLVENVPALLEACGLLINTIVERLPSLLQNLLSAIVQNLPMILTTLFSVLKTIVETLTQSVSELAPIIKDVVVQLTEMLIKESPTLLQGAIDLFMAILDAVPVLIEALLPLIPDIVRSVVETLADNFPEVLAVCFELFDMLQQANLDFTQKLVDILGAWFATALTSIADWWKTLKKTATEIVNSVVEIVKGITGKMRDAGHNVLAGLIDGIVGMKAALIQKVTDIANSMIQAITKPFQIHSPSRKMAWVGQMIDEGLAEGMDDHADDPLETMKRMADSVLNEAAPLPSEIEAHHTVTMQQERTAADNGLLEKLDRILNAIERGKIIAIDGDKIVGATINRVNETLAEQQKLDERMVI
ncbi:MAG: hypothetical protein K2I93_02715 [Oscillospiraceae bacterium]|nr:hypothetical protein [Oscillospiraceae bacterium]